MDRLWTPWRYQYVTKSSPVPVSGLSCIFCAKAEAVDDDAGLVVHRGDRNFVLNKNLRPVASCLRETVKADAFAWLADGPRARFDLVVVDPPSLAKRESDRASAIAAYGRLATSALQRVRRGGVLVTASCSAHVTAEEFFGAVERAALPWNTRTLWNSAHAPDHAVNFREAAYLKCVALRCG